MGEMELQIYRVIIHCQQNNGFTSLPPSPVYIHTRILHDIMYVKVQPYFVIITDGWILLHFKRFDLHEFSSDCNKVIS